MKNFLDEGANYLTARDSKRREITDGAKSRRARKSLNGARREIPDDAKPRARQSAPLGISRLAPSVICAPSVISRSL